MEDAGYGSVQVVADEYLGDGWDAFAAAAVQPDEFQYVGEGKSFIRRHDVDELPPVPVGDECEVPECERDADLSVTYDGSQGPITLCRLHRKEAMGVSS